MLRESHCGGVCGAEVASSTTGTFLSRPHHPRGGMFTCFRKGQKFSFKDELDKDRNTTYIHWTHKNGRT